MSIETFLFSNLKRYWLICFALNAVFAIGNILWILVGSMWVLSAVAGLINGAMAVYSLYRWSLIE